MSKSLEDRVTELETVVNQWLYPTRDGDAAETPQAVSGDGVKPLSFSFGDAGRTDAIASAVWSGAHLHNQDARFLLNRYLEVKKVVDYYWKTCQDALDAAEAARIDRKEAVKAHQIALEEARAQIDRQAAAYRLLERERQVAENKCAILTQRLESDELLRQLLADAQQTWGKMLTAHQDNQKVQP